MSSIKERDMGQVLESIGGYISDINFVKDTLEEVLKGDDPLEELDLRMNRSDGTRKVDLRILYNALARR